MMTKVSRSRNRDQMPKKSTLTVDISYEEDSRRRCSMFRQDVTRSLKLTAACKPISELATIKVMILYISDQVEKTDRTSRCKKGAIFFSRHSHLDMLPPMN